MRLNIQKSTKMICLSIDMSSCQSTSTKRLLEGDYLLNKNGEPLEFNNQGDGSTMKFINQNHLSYYSEDQLELILIADYLLLTIPLHSNTPFKWMLKLWIESSENKNLWFSTYLILFSVLLGSRTWKACLINVKKRTGAILFRVSGAPQVLGYWNIIV